MRNYVRGKGEDVCERVNSRHEREKAMEDRADELVGGLTGMITFSRIGAGVGGALFYIPTVLM